MKFKIINISLSILSLLFTILILEIGARVYKSEYSFHNFLDLDRDVFRSAYPSEFDKELGWVPKKGNHQKNVWNTRVTILNDGIRSNGKNENIENREIILAVGDSFTFGDEVSNDETWPARLEEISNTRVLNGGVFGYGIDQSYLRMQALASKYQPDIIVFSFIPEDIYRCEFFERTSAPKPYFKLSEDNELVLMNDHIPPHIPPPKNSLGTTRKVLGYSFLAHKLLRKAFTESWLQLGKKAHSKGTEVTCRIFEQLKHYAEKKKVKVFILVQYNKIISEKDLAIVDEVITCIDQHVLKLVDLRTPLAELKEHDITRYESLFRGHMTKEGNDFVASNLWRAITKQKGIADKASDPPLFRYTP